MKKMSEDDNQATCNSDSLPNRVAVRILVNNTHTDDVKRDSEKAESVPGEKKANEFITVLLQVRKREDPSFSNGSELRGVDKPGIWQRSLDGPSRPVVAFCKRLTEDCPQPTVHSRLDKKCDSEDGGRHLETF